MKAITLKLTKHQQYVLLRYLDKNICENSCLDKILTGHYPKSCKNCRTAKDRKELRKQIESQVEVDCL